MKGTFHLNGLFSRDMTLHTHNAIYARMHKTRERRARETHKLDNHLHGHWGISSEDIPFGAHYDKRTVVVPSAARLAALS